MTSPAGSFGELKVWEDFLAPDNDVTWGTGQFVVGNVAITSVNEGTVEFTVDEPGGIAAFTTDTADNDNVAIFVGPFKPADGGMVMETRFKFSNVDTSIYAGFTETLALDTPVMPAEFATATMTYNGTGGMIGAQYDVDGTTDDYRAVFADAAASLDSSNLHGVRANADVTADRWVIVRVEVTPEGKGRVLIADNSRDNMRVVKDYTLPKSGVGSLTSTDLFYATLVCENRSANARVLEVDYFYARGFRDWNCA